MRIKALFVLALAGIVGIMGFGATIACAGPSDPSSSADLTEGWSYRVEITNPGTRSEGRIGHLLFEGSEIPGMGESIVTPLGTFEYRSGPNLWDDNGWFKLENEPSTLDIFQAQMISAMELESMNEYQIAAQYYAALLENPMHDTPRSWAWCGGYWFHPSQAQKVRGLIGSSGNGSFLDDLVLMDSRGEIGRLEELGAPQWRHEITIVNPGTRSEGRRGSLFYGDVEFPTFGGYVVTNTLAFAVMECRRGENPWDDDGWFPSADPYSFQVEWSEYSMDDFARDRGWIEAPLDGKLRNTPSNWIYVHVNSLGGFWCDPGPINTALDEFMATFQEG